MTTPTGGSSNDDSTEPTRPLTPPPPPPPPPSSYPSSPSYPSTPPPPPSSAYQPSSSFPPPPSSTPPPGYQQQPGYAPQQQAPGTNVMAILSLIGAFVFAPLGIVFGYIAKRQIKESGEQGEGLANIGLILGYVFTGLAVLGCCIGLIAIIAAGNNTSY
jgi:hypothetical protein